MHFSRVCCSARMHEDDARGGRRSIPRALSPTAPHRILTPASGGRLTGRKAMPRARSGAFWCHFRLGCSPSCPSSILIASSRPSRRVCRLQRRRSARRSSLSARLPGLPSRWPAYFFVRPRGTCSARAAVVGFCARPWGRITLQWRDGALPGPFKRRGCVCAGAACVRHASAPHSLHIAKCGESAHRVLLRSDIYGGQRSNIGEWSAPRPTVRPRAPAVDLRRG